MGFALAHRPDQPTLGDRKTIGANTMLQDKHADLLAEKRRRLLERLIADISRSGYDLYYAPTSEVATYLLNYVKTDANLNADESALLDGITRRDIAIILSLHE